MLLVLMIQSRPHAGNGPLTAWATPTLYTVAQNGESAALHEAAATFRTDSVLPCPGRYVADVHKMQPRFQPDTCGAQQ